MAERGPLSGDNGPYEMDVSGMSDEQIERLREAHIEPAPPRRVAWACGQVSDEWIDAGRAAHLEDGEHDDEYWAAVRTKLERWPEDGA